MVDDGSGAGEVARPAGPVIALVVAVERVRGVGDHGVGLEARRAGLDGAAVGAVGAGIVQRLQKPRVPGGLVSHAPARRQGGGGAALWKSNSYTFCMLG